MTVDKIKYSTPSAKGKIVGIDLGLKEFAILNDGEITTKVENPRHIRKHEKNLKRKQQNLSRQKKGSRGREKARKQVARVHERVSNSRADFLHKLSRKLVDENQVIGVENLNVKGMVKNHKLAASVSDVGWGTFVRFLKYKAEREGKLVVEIDQWFPSSKTCSSCGHKLEKLTLDVREWDCPNCGSHHDRDENAAINVRTEAIRILMQKELLVCGTRTTADGGTVNREENANSLAYVPEKSEASVLSSEAA